MSDFETQEGQQCGDEWIAIKDCQLELACDDLFGDCDSAEGAFTDCIATAEADSYCASWCPDQDRQQCIAQYQSTGTCETGGMGRTLAQVCDEMCGWPDECFVQLGIPVQGSECVQSCQAQADIVGVDCIAAISDTIACLGTCDVQSITQEQALACQDEADAISTFCD